VSLSALIWASQLPLDLGIKGSEAAYRVLTKLADAHHEDSGSAYRDVDRMALELDCSARTVQRALRQLEQAGLILRGDQTILPANMRRDRRPTVYRLPLHLWQRPADQPQLDGVTPAVIPSEPVDNLPRGDRHAVHGVTPGVALGTGELGNRYPAQPQYARACLDGTPDHAFSARTGRCVYCGTAGTAGRRTA
jgi:DNA-binding transcriptional MocR family regulator